MVCCQGLNNQLSPGLGTGVRLLATLTRFHGVTALAAHLTSLMAEPGQGEHGQLVGPRKLAAPRRSRGRPHLRPGRRGSERSARTHGGRRGQVCVPAARRAHARGLSAGRERAQAQPQSWSRGQGAQEGLTWRLEIGSRAFHVVPFADLPPSLQ